MTLSTLFFYLFAGMCVASAFMVIAVKNPVHAVLFLILAFFNAAGLFVLLGAEFLAMILVVVYVGAVLVLFLFVVMMLDVDFAVLGQILYTKYVYLFEGAGLILLVAMIGAIVLTLQHKRDVKRQSVARQVTRTRESGVEVVEVETGRGLS
jgi:NADH-quinone oxidoreductase subunit J